MTKVQFNKLSISNQVNHFNTQLNTGKTISQICNSINISYSTVRDRFKRNHYAYNKISNRYENTESIISIPDLSQDLLCNIINNLNLTNPKLECEIRDSELISRSFRIHSCVLSEFIEFCNKSNFTQQDILTQFIADGLNKYNHAI